MIKNYLLNQLNQLINIRNHLEQNLENTPIGNLRIVDNKDNVQYYHLTDSTTTIGKYIHSNQKELVTSLAQKSYDQKLLRLINRQISSIERFVKSYNPESLGQIYDKMNIHRKKLIIPSYLSTDEFVRRWQSEEYIGNMIFPDEKKHETNRGELVRTKNERAIANIYYEMNIPYRYEYPLTLSNGEIKYPDFTLLRTSDRKIIYHEHLGMIEDDKYRKSNLIKLDLYAKNGIFIGKNLIITYETPYYAFNPNLFRKMVIDVFLNP